MAARTSVSLAGTCAFASKLAASSPVVCCLVLDCTSGSAGLSCTCAACVPADEPSLPLFSLQILLSAESYGKCSFSRSENARLRSWTPCGVRSRNALIDDSTPCSCSACGALRCSCNALLGAKFHGVIVVGAPVRCHVAQLHGEHTKCTPPSNPTL